jgi:proteasome lid subunit RPN8/RPN11
MTRPVVRLPETLRGRIIDHCLQALPNEGCGLIASDQDGGVVAVYPTANLDESPTWYTIPPSDHYEALTDADSNGWVLSGVFHSHPNGQAKPSVADVESALEPDWVYLVVGLRGKPVIRAWRIIQKEIEEISLVYPS